MPTRQLLAGRAFCGSAVLVFFALGCQGSDSPVDPGGHVAPSIDVRAPLVAVGAVEDRIRDKYIVVFRDDVTDADSQTDDLVRAHGGGVEHRYSRALKGFSATLPAKALDAIRHNPKVSYVEQDAVVSMEDVQPAPSWGLDRIDQRTVPLNGSYTFPYTGAGVTAYIIDTGIRFDHVEFEGRAVFGYDAIGDGANGNDCNGHGTHVSGTVGGKTYGVAKQVGLVAVRVMSCTGTGSVSGIMAGLDWIMKNNDGPAVANISLGSGLSQTFNDAVRNLIKAGVQVAIAAGNSNIDACAVSPAATGEAVTVGASMSTDARASFSNWGPCIDVFAPGYGIKSAWIGSTSAWASGGGTSFAAPHVTGVMALWLQQNPTLTPSQLAQLVVSNATQNVVTDAKSANAHVLHAYNGSTPTTPPPGVPPTASFAASCTNLNCSFNASASLAGSANIAKYDWTFGDGTVGTGVTASRSYVSAGTYTVSLRVTDTQGMSSTSSKSVNASSANLAPTASYAVSCTLLVCSFTDKSVDSDGAVLSWLWTFGDGSTSTTRNPSHAFPNAGTFSVKLTVTDNMGTASSTHQSVTVAAASATADFTFTCIGASCQFNDASVTPTSIRQWNWSFGDGTTSVAQSPPHAYGNSGTYSVRLSVTDDAGMVSSATRSVTVTVPQASITLTAVGYKVKGGLHTVDLKWGGGAGSQVTIYRNGGVLRPAANTGAYTDTLGTTGRADYRYKICEIAAGACSNEVLVQFR